MSSSQHALNVFVKMRYVMLAGIKDSSLLTLLSGHVTTASTWIKMHTTSCIRTFHELGKQERGSTRFIRRTECI